MARTARFTTYVGIAVLTLGLTACGGEDGTVENPDGTSSSAPATAPSGPASGGPSGLPQPGDGTLTVADFAGTWEFAPDEPHDTTRLTIDADGTVTTVEQGMLGGETWQGTLTPGGDGTYTVVLSQGTESWTLVLTPGADADHWRADSPSGTSGTLTRLS